MATETQNPSCNTLQENGINDTSSSVGDEYEMISDDEDKIIQDNLDRMKNDIDALVQEKLKVTQEKEELIEKLRFREKCVSELQQQVAWFEELNTSFINGKENLPAVPTGWSEETQKRINHIHEKMEQILETLTSDEKEKNDASDDLGNDEATTNFSPVNEEKELTAELDYYRAINRMFTTELEEQQGEDLEFPEVPTTLPVHIQNDLQRHKTMIKNILNKQVTIAEVVEEPLYDGDSITTSFTNIDFKTDKRKETEVQNQPTQTDINHSELENILEENKALMHVTGNQKKILEEKEQIVLELENKLKLVTAEKEKALLRISKLAGAKLTEDNPGISDLSDTYRPLKIAEMFSELYDNEWTDALSIQISEMQKSEEDAIQNLLEILQQISILCCIGVSEQRSHLYDAMIFRNDNKNPELTEQNTPKLQLQKVKEFQKKTATALFPQIEQSILDNDTFRGQLRKEAELCQTYIRKCIQLCWMMYVQEPAMELVFEFYAGQDIDENQVKAYRKRGLKINYLVWPLLLLHHDGPVAQKGIVQPY